MKKTAPAGHRRRWLYFEIFFAENDSDGKLVEDWLPAFDTGNPMPFRVEPLSGTEFMASAAKQSKVTHRLTGAYRTGFENGAKMRATDRGNGQIFNIEAVLPDRDSGIRYLTLLASSGVSLAGN